MMTYKEYINLMKGRGYTLKGPVLINESSPNIKIFPVKKNTIGKFLEISCPNNTIYTACGKTHPGGCNGTNYSINVECFDTNNNEAFQIGLYHTIPLTPNYQIVAEIIVTKILQKELDKNDPQVREYADVHSAMLKLVGSENPFEYPMRLGIYPSLSKDFLDRSFNLHNNEKMIFYAINPDINIEKVKLDMNVDVLEKSN